jgi:hypothetical protein
MVNARFLPVWTDRASTGYFLPSHSRSRKPTESYLRRRRHMASVDHINRILGHKNSVATESSQRQSRHYSRLSDCDRRFFDRNPFLARRRQMALNSDEPDGYYRQRGHTIKYTPEELEGFKIRQDQILKEMQEQNAAATTIQRAWRAYRGRK